MTKKQTDYLSYLLRLWRVQEEGKPIWRVSLQSPQTRECKGFANLDALFDFLRRQTAASDSEASEQHGYEEDDCG
jgi:hypothetical protein